MGTEVIMKRANQDAFTERAAKALEGIEMLIAMWIEKSVPAAELWVGEEPDAELARQAWRPRDGQSRPLAGGDEAPAVDRRLQLIEERLNHLSTELKTLEARVHEEQPQ
jgi:hypothetical protein